MPSLIVVVPCTLGQTAAVVEVPGIPPGVVVPGMPGIDLVLPASAPPPVAVVGDEPAAVPMMGGEAASVSDVAASTNSAAVATEAAPAHQTLPAIPMAVHRLRN